MLSKIVAEVKKAVALFFSPLQFRVKHWHTAMRGWDEKDIRVLICLEDHLWYWALLEWLALEGTWICHYLHNVPLPAFIRNWERHWDKDDPEYLAKFEDWYGDDFGSLWHGHVCDPVCQWVWKHEDFHRAEPQWELTLDEARKQFAHDPKIYEWVEKELAQHKEWDAETLAEIRTAYTSGQMTREQALEKLEWKFEGKNLEQLLDEKPEIAVS